MNAHFAGKSMFSDTVNIIHDVITTPNPFPVMYIPSFT